MHFELNITKPSIPGLSLFLSHELLESPSVQAVLTVSTMEQLKAFMCHLVLYIET